VAGTVDQAEFEKCCKKNYELAPLAMLEALEKLERGEADYIKNNDSIATYNTTPTLKQAWQFRKRRMFG
jgi:hypothetical protein